MARSTGLLPFSALLLGVLTIGSAQRLPPFPAGPGEEDSDSGAQAPGPFGPVTGFQNIYEYLTNTPEFSDLVRLIDAAPSSADLMSVLDSQCGGVNSTAITLLAPTNDGIRRSLSATQPPTNVQEVSGNANFVLQVLMYHILPTPVPVDAFSDGNSFNSLLTTPNNTPASWAVNVVPGQGIVIQGSTNSAPIQDQGVGVCTANPSIVYSLGGLLIPGTVASNAAAGVRATPPSSSATGSATGSASGAR